MLLRGLVNDRFEFTRLTVEGPIPSLGRVSWLSSV